MMTYTRAGNKVTAFIALAAVVGLFSTGCAAATSPAGEAPGPSASVADTETGGTFRLSSDRNFVSMALDASAAKVWDLLPGVYRKLGVPVEINDAAARKIGTQAYMLPRLDGKRTADWVRCGNQGAGPSSGGMFRTRLTIMTTVREAGDGKATLVTEVGGSASPVEGTSTGPVACASTGDLEQRIRALMLEALAGG